MSMNEKLDPTLAQELREFLHKHHIRQRRVVIDMDAETVEIEDEDDIEAILSAPPDFTPEEAQSAIDNIRRSREEWK